MAKKTLKIVADDKIPFLKGVLEPFAEVRYLGGNKIKKEHLMDADVLIIRTRTKCTRELLEGTRVKFIATATIGFDHIDTGWCSLNGVQWINAPGCNSSSVQQYIASVLVTLASRKGESLEGKTLGVIGVGHVGSKVASLGRLLGMNVLLNDPPRARKEGKGQFTGLAELLNRSDIVTLHVPLMKEGEYATWHMASNDFFAQIKEKACFINASRGEVTDTEALKKAIALKKTGAVAIDVWEKEPFIDLELLQWADIATPHIAGYSQDGKAMGTAMAVRAVSDFFHLPLLDWYPDALTPPANPVISIKEGAGQSILTQSIRHTYDVTEDDCRLRTSPETFEQQRGQYPLRREFGAYRVQAGSIPSSDKELLSQLGFKVEDK